MTITLDHQMLVLDAILAVPLEPSRKLEITKALVDELLTRLEMQVLGPLEVYDAVDAQAPGWSFVQPITTSHIAGHYFADINGPPHVHIDIYSCKRVAYRAVVETIDAHLHVKQWTGTFLVRADSLLTRRCVELSGSGGVIVSESPLVSAGRG